MFTHVVPLTLTRKTGENKNKKSMRLIWRAPQRRTQGGTTSLYVNNRDRNDETQTCQSPGTYAACFMFLKSKLP